MRSVRIETAGSCTICNLNPRGIEKAAKNASVAAAGIMAWALAINEYHAKSKIVKPK